MLRSEPRILIGTSLLLSQATFNRSKVSGGRSFMGQTVALPSPTVATASSFRTIEIQTILGDLHLLQVHRD